jgi:hypothetical protein
MENGENDEGHQEHGGRDGGQLRDNVMITILGNSLILNEK